MDIKCLGTVSGCLSYCGLQDCTHLLYSKLPADKLKTRINLEIIRLMFTQIERGSSVYEDLFRDKILIPWLLFSRTTA